MRERDDDPLLALGSLWRDLAPPDPTATVDAPDAATLAVVARLRAAWCAAAPASSAPPWRLRVRPLRRRLAPFFAAAALLAAVALLLPPHRRTPPISLGDLIVANPFDPIPLVALDAHRMEMRRGPVRLILVTPSSKEPK